MFVLASVHLQMESFAKSHTSGSRRIEERRTKGCPRSHKKTMPNRSRKMNEGGEQRHHRHGSRAALEYPKLDRVAINIGRPEPDRAIPRESPRNKRKARKAGCGRRNFRARERGGNSCLRVRQKSPIFIGSRGHGPAVTRGFVIPSACPSSSAISAAPGT